MQTSDLDRLFRKATALQSNGRLQEASDTYQKVLKRRPGHPPSLHRLGVIAHRLGRPEIAVSLIEAAIAGDPSVAAYHNDLGEMYRLTGRRDAAEAAFRHALRLAPALGGASNNLAILLQEKGELEEAIALYRRAAIALPDQASPVMNLGTALLTAGDIPAAIEALELANRLSPEEPTVMLNLGNARMAEDRPEEAAVLYQAALRLRPAYPQAELNLGRALRELGQPRAALAHYSAAANLAPGLAAARWNEGCCRLLLGDYAEGWHGFAARWQAGAVPPHGLSAPEWTGGSLAGKRLLVHAEQGLGDTLQFLRFLPLLESTDAAEICLLCQPPLVRLLAANGIPVAAADGEPPPHDVRVPLLDLPRLFGITLETLCSDRPYLVADMERRATWRDALPSGRRRIGLVWQGRRDHANDRHRSLAPALLEPLLRVPGISWYSLQKDFSGPLPEEVVDFAPGLDDLSDTAAAIMELDAVVSVDTAVAHLAGALGRQVYLLLPFAPDWRWMTDRDDSPWYASLRLFRQPTRGNWPGAVRLLTDALLSAPAD